MLVFIPNFKICHSIHEVLVRIKTKYSEVLILIIHLFFLIILAVKRLLKEAQELNNPTELYYAQPLEVETLFLIIFENIFK